MRIVLKEIEAAHEEVRLASEAHTVAMAKWMGLIAELCHLETMRKTSSDTEPKP